MLYKVTPNLTPQLQPKPAKTADGVTKEPRKRRKSAVYDAEGNEVLITMMCLKCKSMKPLAMFGLRKMADGAVRNQPWCRACRSGASSKKKPAANEVAEVSAAPVPLQVVPSLAPVPAQLADGSDAETGEMELPSDAAPPA